MRCRTYEDVSKVNSGVKMEVCKYCKTKMKKVESYVDSAMKMENFSCAKCSAQLDIKTSPKSNQIIQKRWWNPTTKAFEVGGEK